MAIRPGGASRKQLCVCVCVCGSRWWCWSLNSNTSVMEEEEYGGGYCSSICQALGIYILRRTNGEWD